MTTSTSPHKALILAAGVGSRLAPLTQNSPKSLVPVNGQPIIFQQLHALLENGIDHITVVTGYKAELLQKTVQQAFPQVHFIRNEHYEHTNNMMSAFLGRKAMGHNPFLMMNADVFFDSSVIRGLLDCPHPNAVVTQVDAYNQESMKVSAKDGRLTAIAKDIPPSQALGTSIDVYKFSAPAASCFFDACRSFIEDRHQRNLWSEVAINDIFKLVDFKPCTISGRWYEIDTLEDLANAEKLFA